MVPPSLSRLQSEGHSSSQLQVLAALKGVQHFKPLVWVISSESVTLLPSDTHAPHHGLVTPPSSYRLLSTASEHEAVRIEDSRGKVRYFFREALLLEKHGQVFLWSETLAHSSNARDDTISSTVDGRMVYAATTPGYRWKEPNGIAHRLQIVASCLDSESLSRLVPAYASIECESRYGFSTRDHRGNIGSESRRVTSPRSIPSAAWESQISVAALELDMPLSFESAYQRVFQIGFGDCISNGEITLPLERPTGREWSSPPFHTQGWLRTIPAGSAWNDFLMLVQGKFDSDLFPQGTTREAAARKLLKSISKTQPTESMRNSAS